MPNYYVKSARVLLAMTTASYSRNKIVERRAPHTQRTWKISMRSHSAGKPPGSRQGSLGKRFMWNIWGRPTSQSLSSEEVEGAAPRLRSSRMPLAGRQCYSPPHHALPGTGYTTRTPDLTSPTHPLFLGLATAAMGHVFCVSLFPEARSRQKRRRHVRGTLGPGHPASATGAWGTQGRNQEKDTHWDVAPCLGWGWPPAGDATALHPLPLRSGGSACSPAALE